ncbi:MAG: serine hydrolase [Acidobacteriaceae bacterium]|nr:serine hydrolase [Acidobacteriaceae bacterium]
MSAPLQTPAATARDPRSLLPQLEQYIQKGMAQTKVPGLAVAVVYKDEVIFQRGFGLRDSARPELIDVDTVFQIASFSKPIASSVVAALVSTGDANWDDRIQDLDPDFQLSDAQATQRLTIRDLLSHRSGLPEQSGDMLEDLGYDRTEILRRLRLLPLNKPFRKVYGYSNFGFTEGAFAPVKHMGRRWEDISAERLYSPLSMSATSSRYSDYENAANKAAIHVFINGSPVSRYQRIADSESPAGGVSSSVRDLTNWLRMEMKGGVFNGQRIIDAAALNETRKPVILRDPKIPNEYYGLGWNVALDANGRKTLSHSGAFFLGTGTTVRFSPSEQLGIIALANTTPVGLPEAIARAFFDLYETGAISQDWISLYQAAFQAMVDKAQNFSPDYSKLTPPSSPAPAQPAQAYTGRYYNEYYGELTIEQESHGQLTLHLPPRGTRYELTHWDGDLFTYFFAAESNIGVRGVRFSTSNGVRQVQVENLTEASNVFTERP